MTTPALAATAPPLARRIVASPVGELTLVASAAGLVAVLWEADRPGRVPLDRIAAGLAGHDADAHLERAAAQLGEYFSGRRRRFDVALNPRGTDFQRVVWAQLADELAECDNPSSEVLNFLHSPRRAHIE